MMKMPMLRLIQTWVCTRVATEKGSSLANIRWRIGKILSRQNEMYEDDIP